MARRKPKARHPGNGAGREEEARQILQLQQALAPLISHGVSHHRLAAAAGVHPDDMKGFLEGRISLTEGTRRRLLGELPTLAVEKESPPGE